MRILLRAICAALALWLGAVPAAATITSTSTKVVALGNGVTTLFNFSFVAAAAADIVVTYTDASGVSTVLAAAQYTLSINPAASNTVWGVGGTVTYPLTGSPIATGTTLTISRNLPYTQTTPFANLGSVLPTAIEMSVDKLTMQAQQLNTLFAGALVQPLTDTQGFTALPAAAARANLALCFDATGYVPVACSIPTSGTISSAMQPVVNAGSLAGGRLALGLGSMATENINGGVCGGGSIRDDGSTSAPNGAGFARVVMATIQDSTSQSVTCGFHLQQHISSGNNIYTLPRANTLFDGFGFWIVNVSGTTTVLVNANDNVAGYSAGASFTIPSGTAWVSTNAASSGLWLVHFHGNSTRSVLASGTSATYTTPVGATQLKIRMIGGGGGGGGTSSNNTAGNGGTGASSSFGGVSAGGAAGGSASLTSAASIGGTGGTGGVGSVTWRLAGATGQFGNAAASGQSIGGAGCTSLFGGGGVLLSNNATGTAGIPNTGSGGGGGSSAGSASIGTGGGGGCGEYVEFTINAPVPTYTYTVGAGGALGTAGTGGGNGGTGGSGVILIEEIYGFLLRRDLDPANDNTPLGLAAVA